ncbi:hypothetical protein EYF80_002250 [Liparis tanakae]|uniref:Uncharacterized protein n=1 Tax=Liparis tanakae TaxID=230148 RepID=A0A4Z2JCM8_9TELE|nr:hypothetical protein EYF80_002250 [Liparis tanakae]
MQGDHRRLDVVLAAVALSERTQLLGSGPRIPHSLHGAHGLLVGDSFKQRSIAQDQELVLGTERLSVHPGLWEHPRRQIRAAQQAGAALQFSKLYTLERGTGRPSRHKMAWQVPTLATVAHFGQNTQLQTLHSVPGHGQLVHGTQPLQHRRDVSEVVKGQPEAVELGQATEIFR